MFSSERNTLPAAALPPSAAGPAAGIASPQGSKPCEALLVPAASFFATPIDEHAAPAQRQHAIGPGQCRWIIADEAAGTDALMCGTPAEKRKPFCAEHCARAYMLPEKDEVADQTEEEKVKEDAEDEEAAEEVAHDPIQG